MNILVTGASGFIGGCVATVLAKRGHDVLALAGKSPIFQGHNCEAFHLDLEDSSSIEWLQSRRFDLVVHAAAKMAGVYCSANDERHILNQDMTRNLLAGLSIHPPQFLLSISTVDVYAPSAQPINETSQLCPSSRYAQSKLATESMCVEWCGIQGVRSGIARLTQVFGPGDRTKKFIPMLLAAIRTGKPFKLAGDGSELRDFLFIDDVAELLAKWTEQPIAGIVNFSSGISRPLHDVLIMAKQMFPDRFCVQRAARTKPLQNYIFDTHKLMATFPNWEPTNFTKALQITHDALR